MSTNLTRAGAHDQLGRTSFTIGGEAARHLLALAGPHEAGSQVTADPVYRGCINEWWLAQGVAMGFRWTTIDALIWHGADGVAVDDPYALAEPAMTFTAEVDRDQFAPAMLSKATGLLVEAARLFRAYEAHHRARAELLASKPLAFAEQVPGTLAKAQRNGGMAERIEAFMQGPWQQLDGLREAREDSMTAFGLGFDTAKAVIGGVIADAALRLTPGNPARVLLDSVATTAAGVLPPDDMDEQFTPYRRMVEHARESVQAHRSLWDHLTWVHDTPSELLPKRSLGLNIAQIATMVVAEARPDLVPYIDGTAKPKPKWETPVLTKPEAEED